MNDGMVIIHTAHDTAEADIIRSVLEQEDIPVYIQGYNHRSLLGVVGGYIDINIMVPNCDAERAAQCIAEAAIAVPSDAGSPTPDDHATSEPAPKEERPKRWGLAIALPFLVPGLGSYYVGRGGVGGWILTFYALSMLVFFVRPYDSVEKWAVLLWPVLMLTDLVIAVGTMRTKREKPD